MMIENACISVIIPYHNEAAGIVRTLEMIKRQSLAPHEVVLIDSGSTDNSFVLVQKWIDKYMVSGNIRFRNLQEGTNVPGSSKNAGVRKATCDIIAFMDCGQIFDAEWLEKQYAFMKIHACEIVSGGCFFEGVNLTDKCAIAHTYGFRRWRPTIPTSMLTRALFDRLGPFLENMRSGYDVEWPRRMKKLGIKRGINPEVIIRYDGINFAGTYLSVFTKCIKYAAPTLGIPGYLPPYIYIFVSLLMLFLLVVFPIFFVLCIFLYLIFRGYVISYLKSKNLAVIREHKMAFFVLPFVGFLIDCGKLIGYYQAGWRYFNRFFGYTKAQK